MKIVGIDVGTHSVHVVELNVTSRGYQLVQHHSLKLKSNANPSDTNLEVIEFLRNIVARHDSANTEYVMGLPQNQVAIRHKVFPYTEKNKITKTLPFELEDELPFAIENAVLDFKTIRHRGKEAEILACATLSTSVEKMISFFKDIGAELKILCPEGIALANLLENHDQPIPQFPAALVDLESQSPKRNVEILIFMGHSHTLVCAFENKRMVASRSVLWGGKNISDAIALKYQLPQAEAQREMEAKGFILSTKQQASFEAKVFSDTISGSVKDLVRDLQLLFLDVKSELNCEIESLLLAGPVSAIQGLGAFLTISLEIPTNRIQLWDRFQAPLLEKNEATENALTIAFGLALEGLKKPRNPAVNLLKGEFAQEQPGLTQVWTHHSQLIKWGLAATIVLFVWGSFRTSLGLQLETTSQDLLKQKATSVAGLSARQANPRGVERYIKQKKQVAQEMKSVEKLMQTESALEILKKISEVSPSGQQVKLDIRRFYVEDKRVWIEGFVRNQNELSLLQQSLRSFAVNGKVDSQRTSITGPRDRLVFALSFQVPRTSEGVR